MSAKIFDMREYREREERQKQDAAARRAYPVIMENIKHLTGPTQPKPNHGEARSKGAEP